MKILGISGAVRQGNHDGAAVLVCDGKIVAAAEEERFIRIKHAPGVLPENAIRFCLAEANLDIQDIDLVVFPGITYENMYEILKNYFLFKFGYAPKIELIDHHLAHAAGAYFVSGIDNTLIITADLSGDSRSTVLFYANNGKITEIKGFAKPNSLGLFYALITQYLGFQYNNDECKVMALSAYGRPEIDLDWLLKIRSHGYELNTRFIDPRFQPGRSNPSLQEPIFNLKFIKKIKHQPRRKGERITRFHKDLASSAQLQLERVFFRLIDYLMKEHDSANLCLNGGVALNAELNSKLIYSHKFKNLFVQPVAHDAGLALGGALYYSYCAGDFQPTRISHLYLGPKFTASNVRRILDRLNINYICCEEIENKIAQALARGKIVAVLWDKLEYGPRALGNRSILANPCDKNVKDKINRWIKRRDNFQPFAPSVIEDDVDRYFDLPDTGGNFDFMIINAKVKKGMEKTIPAVVHVNGTSRMQVVRKKSAPRFYRVLEWFKNYTGVGVVLNTSLNLKGQPICLRPEDALTVFAATPIDCLVIENFWIEK
jgi:carbamoyltransferase